MKTRLLVFMIVLNALFIRLEASNDVPDTSNLIFPEAYYLCCSEVSLDSSITHLNTGTSWFVFYNNKIPMNISEIAQPFKVNAPTPIKSVEVAGDYMPETMEVINASSDTLSYYVRIWNSNLTCILYQARYDTLMNYQNTYPHFKEIIFDSTIVVNGKFYVSFTSDTNLFVNRINDYPFWDSPYHLVSIDQDSCFLNSKFDDLPKLKLSGSDEWIYSNEVPVPSEPYVDYGTPRYAAALLVFPRIDTAYVLSSSSNQSIGTDMEENISIFPNPTKNILNVESNVLIKEIELVNPLGQSLFRSNTINTYNYQLNLDNYPTGTYLIKVQTNSGQATKKVIKE